MSIVTRAMPCSAGQHHTALSGSSRLFKNARTFLSEWRTSHNLSCTKRPHLATTVACFLNALKTFLLVRRSSSSRLRCNFMTKLCCRRSCAYLISLAFSSSRAIFASCFCTRRWSIQQFAACTDCACVSDVRCKRACLRALAIAVITTSIKYWLSFGTSCPSSLCVTHSSIRSSSYSLRIQRKTASGGMF